MSVLQRNIPKRKPTALAPPDKEAVFTSDQVKRLFRAKALDNGTIEEPNALARFQDYCIKNCVSRTANLSNLMLKDHAFVELSNIIWNTQAIGKLIISENQLRETVVTAFADALRYNNSICALDAC